MTDQTDTAEAYEAAAAAARKAHKRADEISNDAPTRYEDEMWLTDQLQKVADTRAARAQAVLADAEATAGRAAYENGDITEALLRASYAFLAAAAASRHACNSKPNATADAATIEARSCAQAAAIHSAGR